jgi:hypothetical protein
MKPRGCEPLGGDTVLGMEGENPSGEPSDSQLEAMLEALRARRAASGRGELDGDRLRAALAQALQMHREHGTDVDGLISLGATCFVVPPRADDPRRMVEMRLGWPDQPALPEGARGRTVHLGFVPLGELTRGPQG